MKRNISLYFAFIMNRSVIFTEDFTRGFKSILLFLEGLELALGLVHMFS